MVYNVTPLEKRKRDKKNSMPGMEWSWPLPGCDRPTAPSMNEKFKAKQLFRSRVGYAGTNIPRESEQPEIAIVGRSNS